jgi:hypothetical protein
MKVSAKRRFAGALAAAGLLVLIEPAFAAAPVSLWHMDETSGSKMVDSVGDNDGTLKNVTLNQPGLVNRAYSFNGTSSMVTVPDNASLDPGASDFSFTASVKFSQVPQSDYDIVRKGLSTDTGGDYKMEILPKDNHTTALASCHYSGSRTSSTLTKGPNLADGAWHTITCKKTATSISITIDGQTFTKTVTVGSISNNGRLTVGAKMKGASGADWYKGLMDEVSVSI